MERGQRATLFVEYARRIRVLMLGELPPLDDATRVETLNAFHGRTDMGERVARVEVIKAILRFAEYFRAQAPPLNAPAIVNGIIDAADNLAAAKTSEEFLAQARTVWEIAQGAYAKVAPGDVIPTSTNQIAVALWALRNDLAAKANAYKVAPAIDRIPTEAEWQRLEQARRNSQAIGGAQPWSVAAPPPSELEPLRVVHFKGQRRRFVVYSTDQANQRANVTALSGTYQGSHAQNVKWNELEIDANQVVAFEGADAHRLEKAFAESYEMTASKKPPPWNFEIVAAQDVPIGSTFWHGKSGVQYIATNVKRTSAGIQIEAKSSHGPHVFNNLPERAWVPIRAMFKAGPIKYVVVGADGKVVFVAPSSVSQDAQARMEANERQRNGAKVSLRFVETETKPSLGDDDAASAPAPVVAAPMPPAPAPIARPTGARVKGVQITDDVRDALLSGSVRTEHGQTYYSMPQLPRDLYVKVAKALEAMGVRWSKRDRAFPVDSDFMSQVRGVVEAGIAVDADKTLSYWPTPPDVAEEVAKEFGQFDALTTILEPSAGDGALVRAIQLRGNYSNWTLVEFDAGRVAQLRSQFQGANIVQADFLQWNPSAKFDRVVMNPPYDGNVWRKHLAHAFSMVKPGGVLIAVLPASVMGGDALTLTDASPGAFRLVRLPENSFASVGTNVATKLLTLHKKELAQAPSKYPLDVALDEGPQPIAADASMDDVLRTFASRTGVEDGVTDKSGIVSPASSYVDWWIDYAKRVGGATGLVTALESARRDANLLYGMPDLSTVGDGEDQTTYDEELYASCERSVEEFNAFESSYDDVVLELDNLRDDGKIAKDTRERIDRDVRLLRFEILFAPVLNELTYTARALTAAKCGSPERDEAYITFGVVRDGLKRLATHTQGVDGAVIVAELQKIASLAHALRGRSEVCAAGQKELFLYRPESGTRGPVEVYLPETQPVQTKTAVRFTTAGVLFNAEPFATIDGRAWSRVELPLEGLEATEKAITDMGEFVVDAATFGPYAAQNGVVVPSESTAMPEEYATPAGEAFTPGIIFCCYGAVLFGDEQAVDNARRLGLKFTEIVAPNASHHDVHTLYMMQPEEGLVGDFAKALTDAGAARMLDGTSIVFAATKQEEPTQDPTIAAISSSSNWLATLRATFGSDPIATHDLDTATFTIGDSSVFVYSGPTFAYRVNAPQASRVAWEGTFDPSGADVTLPDSLRGALDEIKQRLDTAKAGLRMQNVDPATNVPYAVEPELRETIRGIVRIVTETANPGMLPPFVVEPSRWQQT